MRIRARIVLASLVAATTTAGAAPSVHTHVGEVRACQPLDGGDFLVGTGGGLVRVDPRGTPRQVWTAVDGLPGTRIDSLSMVGDQLWVGTETGAAAVTLDGAKLAVTTTVETRSVREVIAFGGATYVATWDGGLKKLAADGTATAIPFRGGNRSRSTTATQNRSRITALAVADGALWAGSAGGLYTLRAGQLELVTIETGANEVTSLYGDGRVLWIATTAGLHARTGANVRGYGGGDLRRVTRVDGEIMAAGLGGGVVRVDRGRLASTSLPDALVMTQALAERGGAACAGGLDGLWLRARKQAAWIAAARPAGPPANDISALAVDGERLWAGTFDHGLAIYEHGAWRQFAHAKIDHRVNALLVEDRAGRASRIWVATATGLSVIEGTTVSQLGKRDGLPARGVLSLARLRDGRILAGTMHGAAILGAGRPIAIGMKQNLEATNVWAVAETEDGSIWLGTTTGLYRGRADDKAWTRYSVATGHLRDDWVMALAPRGAAVWVGTYKGGVTRFEATAEAVTATALGDGWINPSGLSWHGDTLYASTMEGVRTSDGASATWAQLRGMPGKDTTATAMVGGTLWVSTRRGLVARR